MIPLRNYRGYEIAAWTSQFGRIDASPDAQNPENDIKALGLIRPRRPPRSRPVLCRPRQIPGCDFVDIPFKGYLDERYIAERRVYRDRIWHQMSQPRHWESREKHTCSACRRARMTTGDYAFYGHGQMGQPRSYTTTIEDVFGLGL